MSFHLDFHASATAGLEPALAEECRRLGLSPDAVGHGLVRFSGPLAAGALATLRLRSASRVELRLGSGPGASREALYELVRALDWPAWLPPRASWAVRAVGTTAELRDARFTALVVKDAVRDTFADARRPCPPVDPRTPEILVVARIGGPQAVVGLDLGGGSLHERGSGRRGEAPLREDVAAGLALLAAPSAEAPLFDPFCGTGTLIAEAAAIAHGIAPGRDPQQLPLSVLPGFRDLPLAELAQGSAVPRSHTVPPRLAFDADPRMVGVARKALAIQGLERLVRVEVGRVPDLPLPAELKAGLLVANPPWGLRLDAEQARAAWAGLGRLAHQRLGGWRLALLSGSDGLSRELGLRAGRKHRVLVGGVETRWLEYQVAAR